MYSLRNRIIKIRLLRQKQNPREVYTRTLLPRDKKNLQKSAAQAILEKRGDVPRQNRNRLIFLAPEYDAIPRLVELIKSCLAWQSIIKDSTEERLVLDTLQIKNARKNAESALQIAGCAVMAFDFDNFDPKQLVTIINRYGVTSFCAPPTIYRYLMRKGTPETPSLKHASTAGEFLSPDIFHKFTERTGLVLHEGYGQTETALIAANFKGQKAVDGSMGRPSPLYSVKLVQKDGSDTPVGEIGEIVLVPKDGKKPLGVFSSYLDNDELYKNVWRGGVYHTGDAAWQDENGALWFHGRFDDIIKSGGFRIGPYEIENILIEHPAVFECSVVGIPDLARGQAIKAFVVPAKGYEPSKELDKEIRNFCNAKLAEYKWIRTIEFVPEMPKTISGKIRKSELRKQG